MASLKKNLFVSFGVTKAQKIIGEMITLYFSNIRESFGLILKWKHVVAMELGASEWKSSTFSVAFCASFHLGNTRKLSFLSLSLGRPCFFLG